MGEQWFKNHDVLLQYSPIGLAAVCCWKGQRRFTLKPGAVPEVKPGKTLLSALEFKSVVKSKSSKSWFLATVTLADDGTPELNVVG